MTSEDAEAVGALAAQGGRNVSAGDYARFLALEGARGAVLHQEGELIGAATVMRYFEHAFLGPVLLREDADGPAIALLAELIEAMRRDGVTALEAEAASREEAILSRMGFELLRRTLVMERAPGGQVESAGSAPMATHHLLDVGALDALAVGYGRKQYIDALRRELPDGVRVVEREGDIAGFVAIRRAPRGFALGPLITRRADAATAGALLRDALNVGPGERIVALARDEPAFLATLEREGFRPVGALARMRAGTRAAEPHGDATEWLVGSRLTG